MVLIKLFFETCQKIVKNCQTCFRICKVIVEKISTLNQIIYAFTGIKRLIWNIPIGGVIGSSPFETSYIIYTALHQIGVVNFVGNALFTKIFLIFVFVLL